MLISGLLAVGMLGEGLIQSASARNPILWADVPDMSIIRVGDTYYMSSTTMHMSPGLPIMRSTNLVDWELVSYAHRELAQNDALNLEGGKNAYGKGSWASSLRHHNGTFYVSTFSFTTGRTHVYRTDSIESGTWRETSFAPTYHDHSLFFDDDGRAYFVYGSEDIRLVELEADLSGPKSGGIAQIIIPGASRVAGGTKGLGAEGSQLFKHEGRYYLWNITWPQGGMRTQIVHRADKITGPYEGRVVLRDRGIAQGGMVDTPQGDWYAYLFQDHGAVGRIPYLVPMKWVDGWPVLGDEGRAPDALNIVSNGVGVNGIVASDEFDQPQLKLPWQWNHNPDPAGWSLKSRSGYLRLTTTRTDPDVLHARNTLTQRTFGPQSSASTLLDARGLQDGDVAGMIALMGRYGYVGVTRDAGAHFLVMVDNLEGEPSVRERIPLPHGMAHLRIDCDFRDRTDRATFHYSLDGETWTRIGPSLQLRYDLVHFMGCRFGLFASSSQQPGGFADFDFFRLAPSAL